MKLSKIDKVLGVFATLDPTHLYVHHAHMLVTIGMLQPCTVRDICESTGLSDSSVSRTLKALGETNRKGEAGYDLLEIVRDPEEGRRFLVRLNARGDAFRRALEAC